MSVDFAGYEQQRRNIETGYAAKSAAAGYGRFVAQQRGARQVGDIERNFSRAYPQFAASWAQRGARPGIQSGFYQRAMQDYVGDFQRNRNDTLQQLADEQTQFGLSQAQQDAERQRALADLELQKQREIANLAQNIQAIRPYV